MLLVAYYMKSNTVNARQCSVSCSVNLNMDCVLSIDSKPYGIISTGSMITMKTISAFTI